MTSGEREPGANSVLTGRQARPDTASRLQGRGRSCNCSFTIGVDNGNGAVLAYMLIPLALAIHLALANLLHSAVGVDTPKKGL